MSQLDWMQLELVAVGDPKVRVLGSRLHISKREARGLMVELIMAALAQGNAGDPPYGMFDGDRAEDDLLVALDWKRDRKVLLDTFYEFHLIRRTTTGLRVSGVNRYWPHWLHAEKERVRKARSRMVQALKEDGMPEDRAKAEAIQNVPPPRKIVTPWIDLPSPILSRGTSHGTGGRTGGGTSAGQAGGRDVGQAAERPRDVRAEIRGDEIRGDEIHKPPPAGEPGRPVENSPKVTKLAFGKRAKKASRSGRDAREETGGGLENEADLAHADRRAMLDEVREGVASGAPAPKLASAEQLVQFWDFVEKVRGDHDLLWEKQPERLGTWLWDALERTDVEGLKRAYVRFVQDEDFADRRWPIRVFMAEPIWSVRTGPWAQTRKGLR